MRGVNDDAATMTLLVKRLEYINIHPYYVYMHDFVNGVEDLRTSIQTALDIEKHVRGATAGYNTPTFVCDAPGGGGKRDVHSSNITIARPASPSIPRRASSRAASSCISTRSIRSRWKRSCAGSRLV